MNKKLIYLNSFIFSLMVVFAVFMDAQAEDKDYKYGSKALKETSVTYLKQSVEQQKEIIKLLKDMKNDSDQKEIIKLLKEIKILLSRS